MANSLKFGMIRVLIANIVTLVFSLLTNFLLPKFLSVDSYSAIKTFQLYITYIGVLHLGYEDGMYLKYGGKRAEDIDSNDLQVNLCTLRIFQLVMTIVMVLFAVYLKDRILLAFSLAILPVNLVAYFKLLFQAIGEFGKYGRIMNMTAIVNFIINMMCIFILRTDNYQIFLFAYVFWDFILWIGLELYLKNKIPYREKKHFSFYEMKNNITMGLPLTLGNFSSVLLTSIDRWFVKFLMNTLAFAHYSFAVSTESFINVALTPITVTLYNYFCRHSEIKEILKIRNSVMIFASYIVSCAFGAKFIMECFLNEYIGSSNVMFILFAAQICYVVIKGVYVNIYKAQKKQKQYFSKLIVVVAIGIILNILFYTINHCKESFAIGTLFSALIWLILCLKDFPEIKFQIKEYLYMLIAIVAFIGCGLILKSVAGFIIYIVIITFSALVLMRVEFEYLVKVLASFIPKRKCS